MRCSNGSTKARARPPSSTDLTSASGDPAPGVRIPGARLGRFGNRAKPARAPARLKLSSTMSRPAGRARRVRCRARRIGHTGYDRISDMVRTAQHRPHMWHNAMQRMRRRSTGSTPKPDTRPGHAPHWCAPASPRRAPHSLCSRLARRERRQQLAARRRRQAASGVFRRQPVRCRHLCAGGSGQLRRRLLHDESGTNLGAGRRAVLQRHPQARDDRRLRRSAP